jgi:ribose transport system permease protein
MSKQITRTASMKERALRLFAKGGVIVYLVVLVLAFGIANNQFLAPSTLFAVISVSCPLLVVSAAMTMCLICAEVDLSVVGVVGLSSTLTALLLAGSFSWPLTVIVAVVAGGVVGAINGILTGHLVPVMPFFPSFFPTLATTALALGFAEAMLPSKQAIAISNPDFATAFGFTGTFNVPILYALAVVALVHLILIRTSFGYRIQAVGANRKASPLVGTNVRRTKFWVLTFSGLLAGFGGVLTAGFFQAGYSQLGKGYDLDAIGAAVIGGTALFGGKGSVIATVWGVLVLAVLNTGLQMVQVEPAIQLAAKGALVVAVVALNLYVERRLAVS